MRVWGKGTTNIHLNEEEFDVLIRDILQRLPLDGKQVLFIIPDSTRTLPMRRLFYLIREEVLSRVRRLDFLIALGTHPPMYPKEIEAHLGVTPDRFSNEGIGIYNHQWDCPDQLVLAGTIPTDEMTELSLGLLPQPVPVTINRRVYQADEIVLLGPVFPHEVVGFSGGYKYLFPGVSGKEITNTFHWLAALITNPKIIGHLETPVRKVLERAAEFIPVSLHTISIVMKGSEVYGVFGGDPQKAWEKAADLSSHLNIKYLNKPYHTILSLAPPMYTELWVGGKCMYKLEPVVADSGKIIIYAPHIRDISVTHGHYIKEIGYHTRDYFLAQWERFRNYPGGVLAHSTHVKGIGTYLDGVEKPRVNVVLATGIPEEVCTAINLGYLDPASIDPRDYQDKEADGVLVVPRAGEVLYRLKDGTVPDIDLL